MKRTILYLFALFLVMPLAAASEAILGIDGEESTSVGIYIKDLRTDSVLLDFNSQLALTPASVMKCVTSGWRAPFFHKGVASWRRRQPWRVVG